MEARELLLHREAVALGRLCWAKVFGWAVWRSCVVGACVLLILFSEPAEGL